MFKMSEAAALSLLVAGVSLYAPAARADSSCEMVRLAPLPAGLTADGIAQKVSNAGAINVKAVNSARLLVRRLGGFAARRRASN